MDVTSLSALAAKAGLIWVDAHPLWFIWHDDAVHVVAGGGEQPDPFGPLPAQAQLAVPSKETGAAVLTVTVDAAALAPGTTAWTEAAAALAAKRLNGHGGDLPERWATQSRIIRLTAIGTPEPAPDDGGPLGPVSVEGIRPKGWRAMRAHARARRVTGG